MALLLVGLLVPYTNPNLLGGKSDVDANASPFVIAIQDAGIDVLPSVMNTVILLSVLSVGNSAVFGSTRTLAALADLNQAPKILGYVDRKGRPLVAIIIALLVGLLSYLANLTDERTVLDWLLTASGLSTVFTWGSICLCHIRFRHAWAAAGRLPSELPFESQVGIMGSYLGLFLNGLIVITQFWVGVSPVDADTKTARDIAENFFLKWTGAPVVLIFYLAHKFYYRTSYVTMQELDIHTGRREFNLPILMAQEKAEKASWPKWKTLYKIVC